MYLGIDIGGTKTLVAVLNNAGVIEEQIKFPTDKKYEDFLDEIKKVIGRFKTKDFKAGGVGIPVVKFDRINSLAFNYGNLPWTNTYIQRDIERIVNCPIAIENDAKMAALSESMLLKDRYSIVLYVTISTGIGYGLVKNGLLDTNIGDGGGRTILLEHDGKIMPWEDFASGRAIVERFGKKAKDISEKTIWQRIAFDLAKGLIELISITQPEVIVFGGSVGHYLSRYKSFLETELEKYKLPLITLPVLVEAKRPVEAVIYGCYDLAKQTYGNG
jgi:glucokinase